LVVESSIRKAWELVTTQPRAGFDYRTANEDPLPLELFERLKDHVFNKGLIKGLIRFIRGDYAWAMQSAMMLGYAAATHSIADATAPEVVTTSHQRNFQYVEIAKAAGPISIRHLWLKR
jgi:hypothetical protein